MDRKLWNPDDLDRMRYETDPVADAVVESFGGDVALAAELLDALVRTGEGTPETDERLRAFRAQTRALPTWADRAKIEHGQRLISKNLVPGTILLAMTSLPQCYLDWKGAPVLTSTHQLTKHIFRRLIQTSHMVFTVYEPGSLFDDPSAPERIPAGISKSQTVRLMHALMRHLILQPAPDGMDVPKSMAETMWIRSWDSETLGLPINQEDEAYVILTFSYVTIEGFRKLAMILTDEDKDAIIHLWSVVGYVMGVHEGLLAHSYADAAVLFALLRARLRGPSAEGEQLTGALVEWIDGLLPWWLQWFDAGGELIQFFNGEDDAQVLGIESSGVDGIVHAVIDAMLPSYGKVAHLAGQPAPFQRLVNFLAQKMIEKVWAETQSWSRSIDWPDHVRVAATGS
ncbi:MAG: oxygenase MpaB family protein [Nannocystaceae bacterium]